MNIYNHCFLTVHLSWCYAMQFSLQPILWKNKLIASCWRHVTRCNQGFQLTAVSKKSLQSLQKLETNSTFCNRCKPKKVARQVAKRAYHTLRLVSRRHCDTTCTKNCIVKHVLGQCSDCESRFVDKNRKLRLKNGCSFQSFIEFQ